MAVSTRGAGQQRAAQQALLRTILGLGAQRQSLIAGAGQGLGGGLAQVGQALERQAARRRQAEQDQIRQQNVQAQLGLAQQQEQRLEQQRRAANVRAGQAALRQQEQDANLRRFAESEGISPDVPLSVLPGMLQSRAVGKRQKAEFDERQRGRDFESTERAKDRAAQMARLRENFTNQQISEKQRREARVAFNALENQQNLDRMQFASDLRMKEIDAQRPDLSPAKKARLGRLDLRMRALLNERAKLEQQALSGTRRLGAIEERIPPDEVNRIRDRITQIDKEVDGLDTQADTILESGQGTRGSRLERIEKIARALGIDLNE